MFNELDPAAEHTFPAQEAAPQTAPSAPKETAQEAALREAQKEASHRVLRERAENAERKALELERMIQMNMSQQQPTKMQIADEDDFGISDDSYLEGKDFKKYAKKLNQQIKEQKQQLEEQYQRIALAQADIRLKSQFTDFESVVTTERLEQLAKEKPHLHRAIFATTDMVDRGQIAYDILKGTNAAAPYQELDKRVEENRMKPRAAANVAPQSGETPLTRVGDYDRRILSEEQKAQNRKNVEYYKSLKQ